MMLKFAAAQVLEPHLWNDRVILLFTSSRQQDALQQQLSILTEEAEEVTARDLVIYTILPDEGEMPGGRSLSPEKARSLYHTYGITPGTGFIFMLIGKDGTEKMRKKEPVSARELFSLIDSMPMRKAEMRREREKTDKKN